MAAEYFYSATPPHKPPCSIWKLPCSTIRWTKYFPCQSIVCHNDNLTDFEVGYPAALLLGVVAIRAINGNLTMHAGTDQLIGKSLWFPDPMIPMSAFPALDKLHHERYWSLSGIPWLMRLCYMTTGSQADG